MQHEQLQRLQQLLEEQDYIADRSIVMSVYLAMTLRKPLLIEGPAGVGKTEIAKVMARALEERTSRPRYEPSLASSASYLHQTQRSSAPSQYKKTLCFGSDDGLGVVGSVLRPRACLLLAQRPIGAILVEHRTSRMICTVWIVNK